MEDFRDLKEIERSIIKRYRKDIWANFIKGIKEFDLVDQGDKIAVAISGGKDSLLLAKLFQELQRHGDREIDLEFIAMDPGYKREFREAMELNCQHLEIPLKIFESDVFEVTGRIARESPCYMCARMRRGFLYEKTRSLGCNKLALGHHFNDVIETTLLNVLCSGNYRTMLPKLRAENFQGLELIRPMYFIKEEAIIRFMNYTGLRALDCGCTVSEKKLDSKRQDIKELIESLGKDFKDVDRSIFRSAENVDLDGIIGWKQEGRKYNFLDEY